MFMFIQECFAAGQAGEVQIQVESNLVLVDLIASRNGHFFDGLKRDEIEILEDGEPREVAFFQLRRGQGARFAPSGTVSGDSDASIPGQPGPFILLIDLNSVDAPGVAALKEATRGFLKSMPSLGQRYLLVTVGDQFRIRGQFTDEPSRLLAVLEELKATKSKQDYQTLIERVSGIFRTLYPRMAAQAMEESIREAKWFLIELRNRIKNMSDSVGEFARWITVLPGRKTVVFYSAGYPMNSGPVVYDILTAFNEISPTRRILPAHLLSSKLEYGLGDDQLDEVRSMIRSLNSAQVSVYSIDVRGLSAQTLLNPKDMGVVPQQLLTRRNSEHLVAPQEFLSAVAQGTGGLTFFNRNNLDKGITEAAEDSRDYYLVGYVPKREAKKGEYVEIEIKVARDGVELRHRSGYFAPADDSNQGVLEAAFQFPGFHRDFPLIPKVVTGKGRITVEVKVPTDALAFERQDDRFACTLELFGLVFDDQGRLITDGKKFSFARQFRLNLSRTQLDGLLRRETVSAKAGVAASEGDFRVVVVSRQSPGNLLSSFDRVVSVKNE